jgi:hypothetical protein
VISLPTLITESLITDYFAPPHTVSFITPTIPLLPGHYRASFHFAGEPLAEIHGITVKPFEPDAGNAAEGSDRWSCVAEDDDHTILSKKPSDLR